MPRFAEEWRRSTLGHPLFLSLPPSFPLTTARSKDSPNLPSPSLHPSTSTERVASKRVTLKLLRPNKT